MNACDAGAALGAPVVLVAVRRGARRMRCALLHALVAGASSGIGPATALTLAAQGFHAFAGVRRTVDDTWSRDTKDEPTIPRLDVTDGDQIADAAPRHWTGRPDRLPAAGNSTTVAERRAGSGSRVPR